jgi:hypothetical protein
MDIDPAEIYVFEIQGDVIVDDRDTIVTAHYMWVRSGSFRAGNSTNPFAYNLDITIAGAIDSPTFVINPVMAANKHIIVTGRLSLYGTPPTTIWTKLTSKATAGDSSITVEALQDWAVGDEIVIAPSFSNAS